MLWGVSVSTAGDIDVCSLGDLSDQITDNLDLSEIVYEHSIPRAGKGAGHFTKVAEIDNWIDCVVVCCAGGSCDVVFFFNQTCYMIQCNATVRNGCQPVGKANVNATMVVVREPEYLPSTASNAPASLMAASTTNIAEQKKSNTDRTCEIGLQQCPENEVCAPQGQASTRSRHGVCSCVKNHQRDEHDLCKPVSTQSTTPNTEPKPGGDQEDQSGKTTAKPQTPTVTKLVVSAGETRVLQLPENSITLSAYVVPPAKDDDVYQYEWSPVGQPEGSEETATMEGKNKDTLTLSNLIAGLYRLKVLVTGENKYGEAYVNVTVLPPKRNNTPPVAVITPASQEVKSENSFILDGSDSKDDDGIKAYHWEIVSGPLQEHEIDDDTQTLKLKDMAPGNYVFRLTVTDTDGDINSTYANVTVIKETDYPPKANAGSDMVIRLPKKSAVLCGNASTDDKGIATYEWIKKSDKLTADMTGVRTSCLELNNLELGDYTFTLKVTDTGGNEDMANVHVYVKPETNHPPVAKTAGEITVMLPTDSIVLDGRNSTDDKAITAYKWAQTGGDYTLNMPNNDQAVAVVTGDIKTGDYEFKLTVTDAEGQTSTDKLKVHVKQDENRPPVAKAGGDRVVLLPVSLVALDGSASSDDRGIASYLWERDSESLAAGNVVNRSDHQAVLQLVDLVAGRYVFTLTVTDEQGLSSKDTAALLVKNGADYNDLVEMVLNTDIHHFTEEDKTSIVRQLELLIHQSLQHSGTVVQLQTTQHEQTQGNLRLTFFVRKKEGGTVQGLDMVHLLRDKLDGSILRYPIVDLHTLLCQNNCSGHGQCDQRTKACHCEAFWMPNFVKAAYRNESNCEWSILYVVIVCFLIIVGAIVGVWGMICMCRSKRCRMKTRKRHRYSLLREAEDEDDQNKMELMPKSKIQNSSVMISESDFSSEEETIFVNSKPANGHSKPPNGVVSRQHMKAKLKT
ncbi:hypothetical protein V1264_009012 [Littorina saxatilis]